MKFKKNCLNFDTFFTGLTHTRKQSAQSDAQNPRVNVF